MRGKFFFSTAARPQSTDSYTHWPLCAGHEPRQNSSNLDFEATNWLRGHKLDKIRANSTLATMLQGHKVEKHRANSTHIKQLRANPSRIRATSSNSKQVKQVGISHRLQALSPTHNPLDPSPLPVLPWVKARHAKGYVTSSSRMGPIALSTRLG